LAVIAGKINHAGMTALRRMRPMSEASFLAFRAAEECAILFGQTAESIAKGAAAAR
jgi:hypothetical protein